MQHVILHGSPDVTSKATRRYTDGHTTKCVVCSPAFGGTTDLAAAIGEFGNGNLDTAYRVIVIYCAHFLAPQARDMLRAVLETPHRDVQFVFVTTRPDNLEDFLLCRCAIVRISCVLPPAKDDGGACGAVINKCMTSTTTHTAVITAATTLTRLLGMCVDPDPVFVHLSRCGIRLLFTRGASHSVIHKWSLLVARASTPGTHDVFMLMLGLIGMWSLYNQS